MLKKENIKGIIFVLFLWEQDKKTPRISNVGYRKERKLMKISILMGSPRKRDSYNICKLIEDNFSNTPNVEFEYLFLKDYRIEDCKGCDQCFQKGESYCPCKDDLTIIKEKLLQADGIIFASPVYACQVTGAMKRTFDRLSYLFHRQELVGKPALTVVTTGGGGQKPTGKYLKMTACGWGCNLMGEISIISPMFFENKNEQTAWGYNKKYHDSSFLKIQKQSSDFQKAILNDQLPIPAFYDIFMFQCLRSKTFVSKADYNFWKEKGWLDSYYFYKTRLSPAKMLFAKIIKSYIDSVARKMFS